MSTHGTQVKILGKGNPTILGDPAQVERMLASLVQAVGMRVLAGPLMIDVDLAIEKLGVEPFEDEGGVTGAVVLSTSHATVHTWPLREFFVLDLYSCREFWPSVVVDHVAASFEAYDVVMHDLSFSLVYPA